MKVLITGGTGYIGTRLVQRLVEQGNEVRVMTRKRAHLDAPVEQVIGNLAFPGSMKGVTEGIEVVFHLGGGMRPSDGDFETVNIEGSNRLMEDAIRSGVRRFVFMSTATVYGDVMKPPAHEDDICTPLPGHTYAITKLAAEQELQRLSKQGTELVILRPAQVYSAGSPAIGRFPKIAALVEGNNTTHFVHREDVVRAAMLVADHPEANGKYNIADESPLTVKEAAEVIRQAGYGNQPESEGVPQSIPPTLRRVMEATLVLDTDRLRNLGFKYKYPSLHIGIGNVE